MDNPWFAFVFGSVLLGPVLAATFWLSNQFWAGPSPWLGALIGVAYSAAAALRLRRAGP